MKKVVIENLGKRSRALDRHLVVWAKQKYSRAAVVVLVFTIYNRPEISSVSFDLLVKCTKDIFSLHFKFQDI